ARKMDAVYAAVRRLGIVPPSVSTISYELQPEYSQPEPRATGPYIPRVIGYVARNMVRVQVDSIARAGAVIDATVAAGANRIDNLSFELRDPAAARLEALKQAVLQARAMADVIASAAGQRLGVPLHINTSYDFPRPMVQYRTMVSAEAAAPPTPVEAGRLTVSANVNVTYKIEDR
ncbi:MAG TPA: SIMPL domain-containing protein, partial [Lysobacter sp.]|nr:SIMPL domain-containing protein [Lysobacter sp.]